MPKKSQVEQNIGDKLALQQDKMPKDIGQLAEFIAKQTAGARAEVFDALPAIVKALSDKAKQGDTRAATLVLAFASETLASSPAKVQSKPGAALTEAMNWLPKTINGQALEPKRTNGEETQPVVELNPDTTTNSSVAPRGSSTV